MKHTSRPASAIGWFWWQVCRWPIGQFVYWRVGWRTVPGARKARRERR